MNAKGLGEFIRMIQGIQYSITIQTQKSKHVVNNCTEGLE